MKIYLLRHGQTFFNLYGRMQGWSDTPLTQKGIIDLHQVGRALSDMEFEDIYCSDLGRTRHTARIIKENVTSIQDKHIYESPDFRETFFGGFEGEFSDIAWGQVADSFGVQTLDEAFENDKNFADISNKLAEIDTFNNAETFIESAQRFYNGIEKIQKKKNYSDDKNILIVTHGNIIRSIIHYLDKDFNVNVEIANGSITKLVYKNNHLKLEEFNKELI